MRPLGADDAQIAARLLGGLSEPTAADVARFDRIMADAYGADPARPGAFTEPAAEHGGRPVLMALGYSYFLSGHGPRDIPKVIEDCGACEGTGRLGPPLMMDDPSRTASVTARELGGQDEDATVTPRPDNGEPSPVEEGDGAPGEGSAPAQTGGPAGLLDADAFATAIAAAMRDAGDFGYDWPLQATVCPWKIAPDRSGKLTKILAWRGKIRQYDYNTGHDTSEWDPSWQSGYVCSPWSYRIVLDRDADGFEELLARCGIPVSPVKVLTGRPGGYQLHYDGRGLSYEDWPAQRTLYGPDGTQAGDVKSHGFVPVPGSRHPNGSIYRMAPGSGGPGDEPQWLPAYTEALLADQEGLGHHSGSYSRTTGSGRNNALYELEEAAVLRAGARRGRPRAAPAHLRGQPAVPCAAGGGGGRGHGPADQGLEAARPLQLGGAGVRRSGRFRRQRDFCTKERDR